MIGKTRWFKWAIVAAFTAAAMLPAESAIAATQNSASYRPGTAQAQPMSARVITGTLQGGKWKKVLWGWGGFSLGYGAKISAPGGKADCYVPWRVSYRLPATIYHTVNGYGDCWLYSPVNATYTLWPVSG